MCLGYCCLGKYNNAPRKPVSRLGFGDANCAEIPLCRAFAIRDDYPFWKSRNERSHAGKLFFLDPQDKDTLKIFFDDNIGHTAAHIVDVRDVRTGKLIPFQVGQFQSEEDCHLLLSRATVLPALALFRHLSDCI